MFVETKKIPINLTFPPEISDLFYAMASSSGGKSKWAVAAAAYLLLLELDEGTRRDFIARLVGEEDAGKSLVPYIALAKRGGLTKYLETLRSINLPDESGEGNAPGRTRRKDAAKDRPKD